MQTVFDNSNRLIHVSWENNKKLDIIKCQIILLMLTNFNVDVICSRFCYTYTTIHHGGKSELCV